MKPGVKYFSFDVDLFEDDKIMLMSSRFGIKGEIITIKLLCRIYRTNGYFTHWDEDTGRLFAKTVGLGENAYGLVNDVVHELVKRDFFSENIFHSFGVLTSHGIQERYLQATKRRETVRMIAEYCLCDTQKNKNVCMIPLCVQKQGEITKNVCNFGENAYNPEENALVKESKVNKSKGEESSTTASDFENMNESIYEQCQALLPGELSMIQYVLRPYIGKMEDKLILRAVKKAAISQANNWAYAIKILNIWQEKGILSIQAQNEEQRKYQQKKTGKTTSSTYHNDLSDLYIPKDVIEELKRKEQERGNEE